MSYTVNKVMELVKDTRPGLVIQAIEECFLEMAREKGRTPIVSKQNIVEGRLKYNLPTELASNLKVSVLSTSFSAELMEDNDRDFGGANNWTNTDMATFDSTGDLSVTNDTADQSCYLDDTDIITEGHRYRLTYDLTLTSGLFRLKTYAGDTDLGLFVAGTDKVIEFTAPETDELKIVGVSDSGQADFDNFSLKEMTQDEYKRAQRIVGDIYIDYFDEENP